MANEVELSFDQFEFMMIPVNRQSMIDAAPETPLQTIFPVNLLARALHPPVQFFTISEVVEHGEDAKSFVLVPNKEKGTQAPAYFNAGQYLSFALEIDGARLSKPYSICSAPADALAGSYTITVKRAEDGFASDYILDTWKVGDTVETSGPVGNFTYEPLRDPKHIVGVAGGSGITPFHSLASAVADGTEDFDLTILFGSRSADDILLKDKFDALEAACPRIKVVHVLSETPAEGYESGFITAELIEKYAPADDYALFICGPQVMYGFVDKEVEKLGLPVRRVRHELFGQLKNPAGEADYPAAAADGVFNLTVILRDEKQIIECRANETLLVAMERAGIAAPSRCRSGECGFCHSRLVAGRVFIPASQDKRRAADETYGYVHPCCTFPLEDLEIDVPIKL